MFALLFAAFHASAACPDIEGEQLDELARAHHARGIGKLKTAVMSARTTMKAKGGSELAKDAALLLVADVYFDNLGRLPNSAEYYAYMVDSPLAGAAQGRRAVILQHEGDSKGAMKALRSVPGWRHADEPDLIWAHHALGRMDTDEALAALEEVRVRYGSIETLADAEALGGPALTITLVNGPDDLGCLYPEIPAEVSSIESGVARLMRRVDLAEQGVRTGRPPVPNPPPPPTFRYDTEALASPDRMHLINDTE